MGFIIQPLYIFFSFQNKKIIWLSIINISLTNIYNCNISPLQITLIIAPNANNFSFKFYYSLNKLSTNCWLPIYQIITTVNNHILVDKICNFIFK